MICTMRTILRLCDPERTSALRQPLFPVSGKSGYSDAPILWEMTLSPSRDSWPDAIHDELDKQS